MTQRQLERRVYFLTVSILALILFFIVGVLSAFGPTEAAKSHDMETGLTEFDTVTTQVLIAEQIEIVDRGVTRVRVGGQLPDAVIRGKRIPRGGDAAGVLLYDATGQERSGYVTFDNSGNVLLTLDGSTSQTAYFMADTAGVTALRIWHEDDALELRTDEDGSRMTALRDGRVVLQEPPVRNPATSTTCTLLKDLQKQHGAERVRPACLSRMTETWCRACLEG